MKKAVLIYAVALTGMSLAACGNQASKDTSTKATSSKTSKHVKAVKHSKKDPSSINSSTSNVSTNISKNSNSISSKSNGQVAQFQSENSNVDEADPFDASTWNKPYKGYSNFDAYMKDHPNTPNIQSQTAQMQHDWNVKQGIENPDGSETQNFQNWVSQRDQAWDKGQDMPQYDQNTTY